MQLGTDSAPKMTVLHQDDDIVVVNKPSGMLVHRGWDNDKVVAMTLVRDHVGKHVFPVHRLDRPTSGVLVFALNKVAARIISEAFGAGEVRKSYLALVRGITPLSGVIDNPVPKKPGGKRVFALSEFRRLFVFERYSLVGVWPRTGRLHQIRRHLKHITHPLIGDSKYGKGEHNRYFRENFGLRRLGLHAAALSLAHPTSGLDLTFCAPVPDDLALPLKRIGVPGSLLSLGVYP